ncbi:hypothetical protein CIL03_13150 [Virgibacillus indicus]|uniref:Uncharacterized protein n=2 Tax=Virgibacillus indicus TaxID=2024554 RepID=A0A265N8D0_9BACI|nr:hypothetical protein CIL03_13150 [Virgibacillus indicus]
MSNVEASVTTKNSEKEKENEELKEIIKKLRLRIKTLEPPEPVDIQDPPWRELSFPAELEPISDIIHNGANIPFDLIVNKPDYERPAYEEHWHSLGGGRWSYVPDRIHYALHRLFTNYDIGLSSWYDFEHNIGFSIPMFQDEEALNLYIVTFQTEVTDVYTTGNQVVVAGNPKRNGVQVITITTADIKPSDTEENILIQLSTRDGHEMDYSIISYVPPDFWAKQNEKLKERER